MLESCSLSLTRICERLPTKKKKKTNLWEVWNPAAILLVHDISLGLHGIKAGMHAGPMGMFSPNILNNQIKYPFGLIKELTQLTFEKINFIIYIIFSNPLYA